MRKRIPLTDWGDSSNRFGADYFLDPIIGLLSFEFLLEPFPKPGIIKPYYDHHDHKYHTRTKIIHGYTAFQAIIPRSGIVYWTRSPMSFFGVSAGSFQVTLQDAYTKSYYCNLTATRKDRVENVDTKHKLPPHIVLCGQRNHYIWSLRFSGQLWIRLLWVQPPHCPRRGSGTPICGGKPRKTRIVPARVSPARDFSLFL
jgi:hypothetical protein